MILNNYWDVLWGIESKMTNISYEGDYFIDVGAKDINGNNAAPQLSPYRNTGVGDTFASICRMDTNFSVRLGTGDNAYDKGAYALVDDITDDFTGLAYSYNVSADNKLLRTITVSGLNNTNASKEITEVAYAKILPCRPASGSTYDNKTVLYIIVPLTQPITVAAGASFSITVAWEQV